MVCKLQSMQEIADDKCWCDISFEAAVGCGRSIPSANDTRWNSTFKQLNAILMLDQSKINSVLKETGHDHLIMTNKELNQINELVQILSPFSEATDLTQGDKMVTISCVVPVILSLKLMKPHRARTSDALLETLVFVKCNCHF